LILQSKKKKQQREVLRDFVNLTMHRLHGQDGVQSGGSSIAKIDPKVADIGKPNKLVLIVVVVVLLLL
jgi:hypothetical protein